MVIEHQREHCFWVAQRFQRAAIQALTLKTNCRHNGKWERVTGSNSHPATRADLYGSAQNRRRSPHRGQGELCRRRLPSRRLARHARSGRRSPCSQLLQPLAKCRNAASALPPANQAAWERLLHGPTRRAAHRCAACARDKTCTWLPWESRRSRGLLLHNDVIRHGGLLDSAIACLLSNYATQGLGRKFVYI